MTKEKESFIKDFAKFLDKHDLGVETDNTGQIVLYTGLMFDENNRLVPWKDSDEQ